MFKGKLHPIWAGLYKKIKIKAYQEEVKPHFYEIRLMAYNHEFDDFFNKKDALGKCDTVADSFKHGVLMSGFGVASDAHTQCIKLTASNHWDGEELISKVKDFIDVLIGDKKEEFQEMKNEDDIFYEFGRQKLDKWREVFNGDILKKYGFIQLSTDEFLILNSDGVRIYLVINPPNPDDDDSDAVISYAGNGHWNVEVKKR